MLKKFTALSIALLLSLGQLTAGAETLVKGSIYSGEAMTEPLEGAQLTFTGESGDTQAELEGSAYSASLQPGDYEVTLSKDGYVTRRDTLTVPDEETLDQSYSLNRSMDVNGDNTVDISDWTQLVSALKSVLVLDPYPQQVAGDIDGQEGLTTADAVMLGAVIKGLITAGGSAGDEVIPEEEVIRPEASITGTYTYTGAAITPELTVTQGEQTLSPEDYTLTLSDNVNAGTASALVEFEDPALEPLTLTFDIAPVQPQARLTLSGTYTYTGSGLTPTPSVTWNGRTLKKDRDYTLSYRDNVNAGTAHADVTYQGNFTGTDSVDFTISPAAVDKSAVKVAASSLVCTGQPLTPAVTVEGCTAGTDYTCTYQNNINAGDGTVTVQFKGNYTGSVTKCFTISAKAPAITKTAATGTSITLNVPICPGANGSQIMMEKNGAFTILGQTTGTSYTVTGLEPGTDYRFKAFNYISSGGSFTMGIFSDPVTLSTDLPTPGDPAVKYTSSINSVTLTWGSVSGATGYVIRRKDSGTWKIVKDQTGITFTDSGLSSSTSYTYSVQAYAKGSNGSMAWGNTVTIDTKTQSKDLLYYIKTTSTVYNKSYTAKGTVYAGAWYTGYEDPAYPGYVVINYMSEEYLVSKSNVSVRTNAKVLRTGAVGQMGGSIYGSSACGPTAATILVNGQLGKHWNKDDLILYCERMGLNDQGSLRGGGGITAPNLIKLINGYSGGTVTAANLYNSNVSKTLTSQIDAGNRCLVVVQYTSYIVTHYNSGTHFVVVCGYEYIDGVLYFYYADPYYGSGPRSILRVSSSVLVSSMTMVAREPRCIITVS